MSEDNINDDVQNEVPAGDEQPAGTGGLTISDLRVLKMCVEAGSSRGAYQANEMSTVGNTYNRLAMFLAQSMHNKQKQMQMPKVMRRITKLLKKR